MVWKFAIYRKAQTTNEAVSTFIKFMFGNFFNFFDKKREFYKELMAIKMYQLSFLHPKIYYSLWENKYIGGIYTSFFQHSWVKSLTGMHQPETRHICVIPVLYLEYSQCENWNK